MNLQKIVLKLLNLCGDDLHLCDFYSFQQERMGRGEHVGSATSKFGGNGPRTRYPLHAADFALVYVYLILSIVLILAAVLQHVGPTARIAPLFRISQPQSRDTFVTKAAPEQRRLKLAARRPEDGQNFPTQLAYVPNNRSDSREV